MRFRTRWLPCAAMLLLAVGGCGGGSSKKASTPTSTPTASPAATTAPSGGGHKLSISADKSQLKFDTSALTAKAGKVTIVMKNPSAIQHDVAITGNGVNAAGKVVGQGGTSTVSARLKPGKYVFYCSVDAHRQSGMQGTLTVR